MTIRIIVTGGTIDDLEYGSEEDAPESHKSLIPGLLKTARLSTDFQVDILMSKDSKFVTDDDRALLLRRCEQCDEEKIIITHGTVTMAETARYLGERKLPKTIVLVGAAIPANHPDSDALFNLGAAFSAVQLLEHGAYLTMNGRIFSWGNVEKNLETGIFEAKR